jgi:phosphoribosylaminoimidazole-succinocarboxamide synthase
MSRRRRIYEGRGKLLFEGPEPGTLVQHFKDEAGALDRQKCGGIAGKGVLNNCISEFLMLKLAEIGIPTHLVRRLNMREQLVLGIRGGTALPRSIVEFYSKSEELGRPLVSEEHITAFGWASVGELDEIMHLALRVNDFLTGLFLGLNITLVDFRLDFGRLYSDDGVQIVIADEISPDNCRLWDSRAKDKMDKDRSREDLGATEEGYQEVARRLGIVPESAPGDLKPPKTMQ